MAYKYKFPIGKRFGRLLMIEEGSPIRMPNGDRVRIAVAKCDCGELVTAHLYNITHGRTKSCGCLRHDTKTNLRHGMTDSPIWIVWSGMMQRCYDKRHASYKRYGGRGIVVCERWHAFEHFLADMGDRPDGKSLDRWPNNGGNYEPGNCRWATPVQQARNTRSNRILTINGTSRPLAEWAEINRINPQTIRTRLRAGWPVDRAVNDPAIYKQRATEFKAL